MLNIVVVEDEAHVLQGICRLITRLSARYVIVGEACSGVSGKETILAVRPDLVITDIKMPDMDGLEMIRALRERGVRCPFIVLSGYSDFPYVREALQLGSVDYLLKPTNVGDLRKAIEQAEARLRAGEQNAPLSAYSQQQLLAQIVADCSEPNSPFRDALRERIGVGPYSCLLLQYDSNILATETQRLERVAALRLGGLGIQYAMTALEEARAIVLVAADSAATKQTSDVWTAFCENDGGNIAGCLETLNDLSGLHALLFTMRDTLQWAISFPPGTLLSARLIAQTPFQPLVYPTQIEATLLSKIKSGKLEQSRADFDRLYRHLTFQRYPYIQLRETMLCFSASVLFVIRKISYSIYTEINQMKMDEICRRTNSVEFFINALSNGIHQYDFSRRSLDHCENAVVRNVLRIVNAEFREDISLESISARLNLTTEYLSTLFKKETGVNFSAYLPQYRIERAMELMLDSGKKIYEIAELVGYHDTAYFCKVFKRIAGASPKEYMKSVQ